jgi:glutamine synthetase
MLSLEQLEAAAATGEIDTVVVAGVDVQGKLFGKRVPADLFVARSRDGIHTSSINLVFDNDQAILEGFPEIGAANAWADMHTVPDVSTLRRYAHHERTAICLSDSFWEDGRRVEYLPRHVLRRQLERCAELGMRPLCAVEPELFLFGDTYAEARAKGWHGLTRLGGTLVDYSIYQSSVDEPFIGQLRRHLIDSGIPVECTKAEYGVVQHEINLTYAGAMEMADRASLLKAIAKELAAREGISVTFMARFDHRESGSSGHTHLSLWDEGGERNLFAGAGADPAGRLSPLGRSWLAGQLEHAPELMLLSGMSTNSYKRLDPDNFAPTTVAWGFDVRTVPFRVVGLGGATRIEYRIPGADANFYLVLAGLIAAGLSGVERELPLELEPAESSVEVPGERIPTTLRDALARFEGSAFAREMFGDVVVDHLATTARHELAVYDREVSDLERRRYFEWA